MNTFSRTFVLVSLGLSQVPTPVNAALQVVATTPDIAAIAHEVGGSAIDVTTLAKPTEDPHFVDARPSFIVKLNHADVLLQGGAQLEAAWLGPLLEGARNPKIRPGAPGHILCSQGVTMLEVPSTLDRSQGDIHAAGNPHYLVDPENARILAQHLAEALSSVDAKNGTGYRANLQAFLAKLDAKIKQWDAALAPYKGRQFVSYHNSWIYFAKHFGLESKLFLEPKPGIPPTPTHLAEVIIAMKQENVRVILVDPYLNRRTADTVAAKTGATVLEVTQFPGGVKGTEGGYIPLMDYLVSSMANAFAGK